MRELISFVLSIGASIVAYYICKGLDVIVRYICKWLDRWHQPKMEAPGEATPGAFFMLPMRE